LSILFSTKDFILSKKKTEGKDYCEVDRLIARKIDVKKNIIEYLVCWKGWDSKYNAWIGFKL
jgi:hypothetical protein